MRSILLAFLFVSAVLGGCVSEGDAPETESGSNAVQAEATPEAVPTVPGRSYNFTGPYSRVLVPGDLPILQPEAVRIPSLLDGADIYMGIHRPDTEEPVPILLFASPYFGFLGGANNPTDRGGAFGSLIENFVPHGYAVAGLAIRGTGDAGGCNDLMGPQETADLDQAVTWLGSQDWSNGNVAMTGVSYDGSTPWGVASTGNPHLKTIIPISGVPDMYGLMYRNGSSETRGPLVLNGLYYAGNIAAGTSSPQHTAERLICPDAAIGIGLSGTTGITGMTDPMGWWDERNRKPGVEANYKGSVYSIQGMQDWNVDPSQVIPWVDELDKMGIKTKQLLGQWGHAWPDYTNPDAEEPSYRVDWKEILLRWMDSELKGMDVDTGPAVQIRDNLGRWRNEDHFPPRDADWQMLNLRADRTLDADDAGPHEVIMLRPLLEQTVFGEGVPLPDFIAADTSYADFVLPHQAEEMLISGLPRIHIDLTPLGPGGYIGAYLYERAPDGTLTRLGWTTMNLAFHAGGTQWQPVTPGQMINAKLEIQPMDGVIREGHQLVLRVWAATDADRLPTIPPSAIQLHVGDGISSMLKLPVIERDESAYFMPPVPPTGAEDVTA